MNRSFLRLFICVLLCLATARAESVVEQWRTLHDGAGHYDDSPIGVVADGAGNVFVLGSASDGVSPGYLVKYDAKNGALLWQKQIAMFPDALTADASGDVIVTGTESLPVSGIQGILTVKYSGTAGALLWQARYQDPGTLSPGMLGSYPASIAVDAAGNVAVAGTAHHGGAFYSLFYVAKYAAASGTTLWERAYSRSPASAVVDALISVAFDPAGNVLALGKTGTTASSAIFCTTKFAGTDGTTLWETVPSTGLFAFSPTAPNALVVDGAGNAIVGGAVVHTGGYVDAYTAKYAAATGALVWEKYFDGPTHGYDATLALAVDSAGNVAVTGVSAAGTSPFGKDYVTLKYAADTGAELWSRRYDFGADDSAAAVAFDDSGNVVITGTSSNGTDNDLYTAKYAAADGAIAWEKRFTGAGNDVASGARALALTATGTFLTFQSFNGSNLDIATLKYAAFVPPGPPAIASENATAVGLDTATLNALISPDSLSTSVHFEYGLDATYGTSTPTQNCGPAGSQLPLSAPISGLLPNTLYHFRAVAQSSAGTTAGADATFTSAAIAAPSIDSQSADLITSRSARFNAQVNPHGGATTLAFAYRVAGTDFPFLTTTLQTFGAGTSLIQVSAAVEDLQPHTLYEFALFADNSAGQALVTYAEFSTLPITEPLTTLLTSSGALTSELTTALPAGSRFKSFGLPHFFGTDSQPAFLAQVQQPDGRIVPAIVGGHTTEGTGVDQNALFSAIKEPSFNFEGCSFIGTLLAGAGVSAGNDTGIWNDAMSASSSYVRLIAREKQSISYGTSFGGPVFYKSFSSVLLSSSGVTFWTAKLSGTGVTATRDEALFTERFSAIFELIRKGAPLSIAGGSALPVKSFSALVPSPHSFGGARYDGGDVTAAKVIYTDKSQALVRVGFNAKELLVKSGDPLPAQAPDPAVTAATFGLPALDGNGQAAFAATLARQPGTTTANNAAMFAWRGETYSLIARKGGTSAALDSAQFAAFFDPLRNRRGDVAFLAKLSGAHVTGANNEALLLNTQSGLKAAPPATIVVARKGSPAPGIEGAIIASLGQFVLPDNLPNTSPAPRGPIFTATLKIHGTITAHNNSGLWAMDANGTVRLLARTGPADGKTIRSIDILKFVSGASGAARGFNPDGATLFYRVTYSDLTQAIKQVELP